MTLFTTPGWFQNAGAVHTAEQMRNYAGALFIGGSASSASMLPRGGVHPALGNKMQVTQTASPSMGVLVKSGMCAVPGTESGAQGSYAVGNDGDVTLSISAAHATLARIDIAVVRIHDSAYSGALNTSTLEIVTGTPSSSPAVPTTPDNSLVLGQIAVAAGATSISDANITDTRRYLAGPGGFIPAATASQPTAAIAGIGQAQFLTDSLRARISTGSAFRMLWTEVTTQVFTSSGTWTKPTDAGYVHVRLVGGGGGGGGVATTSADYAAGAGGGGGGYAEGWFAATALGSTVTVTVGAAGAASAAGNSTGGTGGTSIYSTISATGGTGGAGMAAGTSTASSAGGNGGTGTSSFYTQPGGAGQPGTRYTSSQVRIPGTGGDSALGFGAPERAVGSGNGITGSNYGGGGSGARGTSAAAFAGGAGAPGVVIVTTYR